MAERGDAYFGFQHAIILDQLAQCLTINVVAKERSAVLAEPNRTQPRAHFGLGGPKAVTEPHRLVNKMHQGVRSEGAG